LLKESHDPPWLLLSQHPGATIQKLAFCLTKVYFPPHFINPRDKGSISSSIVMLSVNSDFDLAPGLLLNAPNRLKIDRLKTSLLSIYRFSILLYPYSGALASFFSNNYKRNIQLLENKGHIFFIIYFG
jgi:hypothetical protein